MKKTDQEIQEAITTLEETLTKIVTAMKGLDEDEAAIYGGLSQTVVAAAIDCLKWTLETNERFDSFLGRLIGINLIVDVVEKAQSKVEKKGQVQ